MIKLINLRVALSDGRELSEIAASRLNISAGDIRALTVMRKAADARRKGNICFVYTLALDVNGQDLLLSKAASDRDVSLLTLPGAAEEVVYGREPLPGCVAVAGAGPAGLTAAILLAEHGYKPLVLERGCPLEERAPAVAEFWRSGNLLSENNVQFGEGGAGTFSDGKLTTRVHDPAGRVVLEWLAAAGAPAEILYEYKPHVGTDRLRAVVKGLTARVRAAGGQLRFNAKLTDLTRKNGALSKIAVNGGEQMECGALILATGHSARDTYRLLLAREIAMEAKPFSVGLRIEHQQELIDKAQYGFQAGHEKLGAADYALVYHDRAAGRSAYSFCMCPGGQVIAAASGGGELVTNGMSLYKRDSGWANSALAVNVGTADFGVQPLAGLEFQEYWERRAFAKGGGDYCAPAESAASFLAGGRPSLKGCRGTYAPGIRAVSLREVLPPFVTDTLLKALPDFGRKIRGFEREGALLTGIETRTSAPVRILRSDQSREAAGFSGLYPAGEGSGYAGGIISAAIDGYYAALALMRKYRRPL